MAAGKAVTGEEVMDASTAVADGPGSRQTLQTLLSGRGLLLTLSHNGEWQNILFILFLVLVYKNINIMEK